MNRRQFLAATSAGLAIANATNAAGAFAANAPPKHSICVFTKPFNSLSFEQLADAMAKIGFNGIEAPIRKGGHVEPEQVPDKLPELAAAMKKRDLEITLMTTDINDPNDPLTETVLKTAAELGITRYRMKYLKYDMKKAIRPQIENWKSQIHDLAAMNKELGITGLYQNHAGRNYLGAGIWDLALLLDGVDKNDVGVAYDIRHATVEGGTCWPIAFKMITPHISMVYVKDFQWGESAKPKNVPLGEGRVDGKEFVKLLAQTDYDGPISLHEEYLNHKDPELVPQHLAAMKKDLATLNGWLGKK